MSGPKPDHSPKPSMDLKMTGATADAVNRQAFAAREAQVRRYGAESVSKSAGKSENEAGFEAKASEAYKQASTGERGTGHGVLSREFRKDGLGR